MSFQTLAALKRALDLAGVPTADDALLQQALDDATGLIQQECRRLFIASGPTAITVDAPYGAYLPLPDFRVCSAVTAFGADLVVGTDYQVVAHDHHPIQVGLLRLEAGTGWSAPWVPAPQTSTAHGAIHVTATWGWSPLPPAVVACCEAVATILWRYRAHQYQDAGTDYGRVGRGTVPQELLAQKIRVQLTDYLRARVRPVIGGP